MTIYGRNVQASKWLSATGCYKVLYSCKTSHVKLVLKETVVQRTLIHSFKFQIKHIPYAIVTLQNVSKNVHLILRGYNYGQDIQT